MTDDARETAPTPSQVYARGASEGQWQNDPAQHPALAELDRMADAGQLDRDCVAAVHSHLDQFLAIYHRYQDDKPDATPPQA